MGAKTKRKPDAPFMAMFAMYASNKEQQEHQQSVNDNMDDEDLEKEEEDDGHDGDDDDAEEQKNNADNGSSPPLNPLIPSHDVERREMKVNPLDNLRERYYKQNIPQSLTDAFQSEHQKAIQNDLNEDDSLLGGIRQSVQMMTHSNSND